MTKTTHQYFTTRNGLPSHEVGRLIVSVILLTAMGGFALIQALETSMTRVYIILALTISFYVSAAFVAKGLLSLKEQCAVGVFLGRERVVMLKAGYRWESLSYFEVRGLTLRKPMFSLRDFSRIIDIEGAKGKKIALYPRIEKLRECILELNTRCEACNGIPISGYSAVMSYLERE